MIQCLVYVYTWIHCAGALVGGKTRHHVPIEPETVLAQVATLEVLVLGKLALRVAIAQQLGVDTHPGPGKQEICRQDDM